MADRCEWRMPDDARFCDGARCVRDAGHQAPSGRVEGTGGHVIAELAGDAIKLWRVDELARTAQVVTIGDGRDGRDRTDEDAVELWKTIASAIGSAP